MTEIEMTRVGPVYLWWSEYNNAAVIGPDQGAWGGDNVYRCDECPGWQSDDETAEEHAAKHGYYVKFLTITEATDGA
jgi:hypothetical protein